MEKPNRSRLRFSPGDVARRGAPPSVSYFLEVLFEVVFNYPIAFLGARRNRSLIEDIERYCMFIGYPRSGHSLISALLDAHPEAVCANELGVLKYLHAGYAKRELFYLLMQNAKLHTRAGNAVGGYSYQVPRQYQGRWNHIRVIGDKQGSGAVQRLQARPWLLNRLRRVIDTEIHFIHVIRNPFDMIQSTSKMSSWDLDSSIAFFFRLCDTILTIRRRLRPNELIEFRHEDFLASPEDHLLNLCRALGLQENDDYIRACCGIIWEKPHITRSKSGWTRGQIRHVLDGIERIPYLEGYTYH